jgi:hypothetical protein
VRRWVPLALGAIALVAIAVAIPAGLRARRGATHEPTAQSITPPGLTASGGNGPAAPAVSASADAPASVAASASAAASSAVETSPKTFERAKAQAALDTAAVEAAPCKLPRGYTCQMKVVYAPDGHVQSVVALKRCSGSAVGACIASHLKSASIEPFEGRPTPYVYTFVGARASRAQ